MRSIEDWWFDKTRSVKTVGNALTFDGSKIVGEIRDSLTYIPVRVLSAKIALRGLPIDAHSGYTFIDMGSGKGRMLFLAAELPFRKIQGVEFDIDLHREACANIRRYRSRKRKCFDIESTYANAADFKFPNHNLVVGMFNPFGPQVLTRMLANLVQSLEEHPRHVVVLMLWPAGAELVAQTRGMRAYRQTRRHHIYQTTTPARQ